MTQSNRTRPARFAAILAALYRMSIPAVAVGVAVSVPGCIFGSPGPSNVSLGEQYASGNPSYDQFFSELFLVQLKMGQAPEREAAIRAHLAKAGGIPENSGTNEVAAAIETRTAQLAMSGIKTKVATSGVDGTGAASASLVTTGNVVNPDDVAFLATLDQALKDDAVLLSDMRQAKPSLERLQSAEPSLEPGVDAAFHKGGAPKKAEVRKNLNDAKQLTPLMLTRADEIAARAVELLQKLEHAIGTTAAPAAATEESKAPPALEPTRRRPSTHGAAPANHSARTEEAPAPKPAPTPAKPTAAPDGFEP